MASPATNTGEGSVRLGSATNAEGASLLAVFFDGSCPLCSRGIRHYGRLDTRHRLRLVDISAASFDAATEGVDARSVHVRFHARLPDGTLVSGVDAFCAIWEALDIWPVARACGRNRILRLPLDGAYAVFARIRPLLRGLRCRDACEIR